MLGLTHWLSIFFNLWTLSVDFQIKSPLNKYSLLKLDFNAQNDDISCKFQVKSKEKILVSLTCQIYWYILIFRANIKWQAKKRHHAQSSYLIYHFHKIFPSTQLKVIKGVKSHISANFDKIFSGCFFGGVFRRIENEIS